MVVTTTDYGTFITHEGTLAEVMAPIVGQSTDVIKGFTYNPDTSKYALVVKRG